jgi:hypothetical protein
MTEVDLIIDCGHGGNDHGASYDNRLEKDYNLINGLYLYNRFNELKVSCLMTRDKDTTLENGTRVATAKKGKFCISNHLNASTNHTAHHGEVIHSIFANGRWANIIRDEWEKIGKPTKVYSKANNKKEDYYYMHRLTGSTETLILEYCFIDNDESFTHYVENMTDYLEGVVRGYCRYQNISYTPPSNQYNEIYRVQVGAFDSKENAENLLADLQNKGYPAFVLTDKKDTL